MLMVVKLKKDTQIAAYRNCLSIGKQKKTTQGLCKKRRFSLLKKDMKVISRISYLFTTWIQNKVLDYLLVYILIWGSFVILYISALNLQ